MVPAYQKRNGISFLKYWISEYWILYLFWLCNNFCFLIQSYDVCRKLHGNKSSNLKTWCICEAGFLHSIMSLHRLLIPYFVQFVVLRPTSSSPSAEHLKFSFAVFMQCNVFLKNTKKSSSEFCVLHSLK